MPKVLNKLIVLGLDPGYDKLGWAVISGTVNQPEFIMADCFRTSRQATFPDRLLAVGQEVERVVKEYRPMVIGLEKIFFATNRKTANQVAEVRGVAIYLARYHHLPLLEYTPLQVKVRTTGWGQADKKQVISMVTKLIKLPGPLKEDDAYDALAIALVTLQDSHSARLSTPTA